MHRHVNPGMEMTISYPVNLFPLDSRAKKHLMIAGGIGITPFLAQIAQITHFGGKFELHYSARSKPLGAYMDRLTSAHPDRPAAGDPGPQASRGHGRPDRDDHGRQPGPLAHRLTDCFAPSRPVGAAADVGDVVAGPAADAIAAGALPTNASAPG